MSNVFNRLLHERPHLLADGALGTNLFAMGLETGDAPELWNIEHPERIADLAQQFIDAGSDILLTNSFGGTRFRLKLHRAEDRVYELNRAAARIVRERADGCGRDLVVAGSMGPTGELFAPSGTLTRDEAFAAFQEQANALKDGGADVLWVETMSSCEETKVACEAAASTGLPVVYTLSLDTHGRTMMGVTPAELVQLGTQLDPAPGACGTNCGVGASEVVAAIINMKVAADQQRIEPVLVAKANCGIPEYIDGKIVYSGTPELMARYAQLAADAGARIIGGCCGTTPGHIAAMRQALDGYQPGGRPDLATVEQALGEISSGAKALLAGEPVADSGGRQRRPSRRGAR
jgi:5-methyltetrahydrofolate--homocysteine methyltransferase